MNADNQEATVRQDDEITNNSSVGQWTDMNPGDEEKEQNHTVESETCVEVNEHREGQEITVEVGINNNRVNDTRHNQAVVDLEANVTSEAETDDDTHVSLDNGAGDQDGTEIDAAGDDTGGEDDRIVSVAAAKSQSRGVAQGIGYNQNIRSSGVRLGLGQRRSGEGIHDRIVSVAAAKSQSRGVAQGIGYNQNIRSSGVRLGLGQRRSGEGIQAIPPRPHDGIDQRSTPCPLCGQYHVNGIGQQSFWPFVFPRQLVDYGRAPVWMNPVMEYHSRFSNDVTSGQAYQPHGWNNGHGQRSKKKSKAFRRRRKRLRKKLRRKRKMRR